ncbi:flavin-binding family monooxygenase [Desmospora sp. 8437]|nr:flavin-binding family monooxygenase [Desmospora sp. 8437]
MHSTGETLCCFDFLTIPKSFLKPWASPIVYHREEILGDIGEIVDGNVF